MFLDKILQSRAEKFDPVHPKDPGLVRLFGGLFSNTNSGVQVTPQNALESTSAVYSAVTIIAETIASLPWVLYEIQGDGKKPALNDPRYNLLYYQPNRFQDTVQFREMIMTAYLTRGRAVIEKVYNVRGVLTDLIPLHPDEVDVFKAPTGKLAYRHVPNDGPRRMLLDDEVVDIRGNSINGIDCISPITANAETLGIAKASDIFAAKYFGNGTTPTGILETEQHLSDTAYQRLKEWTERHQGVFKSHNPAILEEGLSWKSVMINAEDSQLLQNRSFSVEEVARIYRIPAYKLQRMDSVKFNTTEQQAIDFVTDTILPRANKIELAFQLGIFSRNELNRFSNQIKLKELLRGDSKTRVEYYNGLFNMGAINADTIRTEEGYNPIPDNQGNRYFVPVNLIPSDKLDEMLESKTRPQPTMQGRTLRPFVKTIFDRIVNAEINAESRGKDMVAFFEKHESFIQKCIEPLVDCCGDEVRDYFKDYFVNGLVNFDKTGLVNKENHRSVADTENFMKWLEEKTLCHSSKDTLIQPSK